MKSTGIYLDHASSTPLAPEVSQAMQEVLPHFGNPSAMHKFGQKAKSILNSSRRKVAQLCQCLPEEIIFTPSATISNNLMLQGLVFQEKKTPRAHFIISPLEHPSVSQTALALAKQEKITLSIAQTDKNGVLKPQDIAQLFQEDTKLVSITSASSEVGTLQPLEQIAKITKKNNIILHTDATQAITTLGVDCTKVDALTLSSHKIYGPKGAGLLFLRQGITLQPLFYGGSQENGKIVGTENLIAIVGLTKALEIVVKKQASYYKKMKKLGELLDRLIAEQLPRAIFVGDKKQRLVFHRNYIFPGCSSGEVLMHLDLQGICASSRSACASAKSETSPILLAMGYSKIDASSALRISLGTKNNEAQIICFVAKLKEILHKVQRI